jgi:hypothetical protein
MCSSLLEEQLASKRAVAEQALAIKELQRALEEKNAVLARCAPSARNRVVHGKVRRPFVNAYVEDPLSLQAIENPPLDNGL